MKISEMLYDATKYPFSGLKQLLVLGFLILISSLLFGDYFDLNLFSNSIMEFGFLTVISFIFIIGSILLIIIAGYPFKIIEESISGGKKPPKLNDFAHMFKHGIYEIVIGITYFSVPLILFLVVLDDVFSQIYLGLPSISDEITILFLIVVIVIGFFGNMIFTVAIPHMAFKGGSFREAFRLVEIFGKIKKIGFKKLIIGYLIVVIGVVVIGGPILKEIVESTNIFGFVIAEELIAPYIIMFAARFNALIYME